MAGYMLPYSELQESKKRLERKMEKLTCAMALSIELVCNDRGARYRRDQECMEHLCDSHKQVCAQIKVWKRSRAKEYTYWHKMSEIGDTLEYLNRLGFGIPWAYRYPGWIVDVQEKLVKGETSLASVYGYPFWVHYSRKNGHFNVKDGLGRMDIVEVDRDA